MDYSPNAPAALDPQKRYSLYVLMPVETLGEALSYRWRVTARCAHGKRDGMKSIRECVYNAELDMETLVWTRGRAFPLSRRESRLRCPLCGSHALVAEVASQ
jgi:hypothetical protein